MTTERPVDAVARHRNREVNKTACAGTHSDKMKPKVKQTVKIDEVGNNKKVYFGEEGQEVDEPVVKPKALKIPKVVAPEETEEVSYKKPKKSFNKHQQNGDDLETKWYQFFEEHNTSEFKEIKDSELSTLQQLCRNCFNDEIQRLSKSKSTSIN